MRIFVTGGTGFLGSHFLNHALNSGFEVTALRRPCSNTAIPLPQQPKWVDGTLGGVEQRALEGFDAIVHLASNGVSPQKTDWETAVDVNVSQSACLIEKACKAGVPKILLSGSCFEYGDSGAEYEFIPANAPLRPNGPYAASKAAFSLLAGAMARSSQSEFVLLRPFHFYGEGQHPANFWPALRKAALTGKDFEMTAGEQIRDYQTVGETAESFLETLRRWPGEKGKMHVKNLGSGKPIRLIDFAHRFWEEWNAKGRLETGSISYRHNEVMRYVPEIK
jgi:nucleoside-diphosphate-sugar epimerase